MIAHEGTQNTQNPKLLIAVEEAAKRCSVSRSTIIRWVKYQGLPTILVGGRRLICPDQLREWIQRRHEEQASR